MGNWGDLEKRKKKKPLESGLEIPRAYQTLWGDKMAFDVSNIVSAVNKYLYSISDMNNLAEGDSSGKSSVLSGIFQKYLNKAVEDTAASGTDSMTDADVLNAVTSLSGLATSSAFDTTSSASSDDGLNSLLNYTLPDLVNGTDGNNILSEYSDITTSLSAALKGKNASTNSSTTGNTATLDGSVAAERTYEDSLASAINSEIQGKFANLDLESQIKQPFQNLDLVSEINNAFKNADVTDEFEEAFRGIDLKAEIENSIASHNKMDEAVSYNARRLQAYKNSSGKNSITSSFGDFRL